MPDSPYIFFYYGNDEFAIRKQAEKFDAMFSDPTTAGMNTARLDARTASESDLGNAVGAMVGVFGIVDLKKPGRRDVVEIQDLFARQVHQSRQPGVEDRKIDEDQVLRPGRIEQLAPK